MMPHGRGQDHREVAKFNEPAKGNPRIIVGNTGREIWTYYVLGNLCSIQIAAVPSRGLELPRAFSSSAIVRCRFDLV